MELVEGPTLADRITQGAIPVDEALPIAKQIAEALEAAHEQGIIHRDLKPANVKLRPDGVVKVLDFGLAKALEPTGAMSPGMSQAPTITTPAMTQAGMILGTAAYMSPEQARGKPVDKRSDIWAFGCVLFEMITGQRAFSADEVSDTLAYVLTKEIDWATLPSQTPTSVRYLLGRCLDKDAKGRLRDIGEARLALEGAFDTGATDATKVTSPAPRWWSQPRWVATGVALGMLAGLGTGWAVWVAGRADADTSVRRFQLDVPASVDFPSGGGTMVGLSPDGQTVVYRGFEDEVSRLYQRRLDQLSATIIPGTQGAVYPFFSPDSQSLAFGLGGSLMRVALAGGSPTRIADLGANPRGGSWGLDDTIVVGLRSEGLARVSATGGEVESLTTPDDGREHWYPHIVPGGRAVLFTGSAEPVPDSGDVMVLDLETGEPRTVVVGGVAGHYTPTGHLVFLRGGDLWVVGFDLDTLTVQGQPALVEQGIRVEPGGAIQFAVAEDGGLTYLSGTGEGGAFTLVWVSRDGREESVAADPAAYQEFTLSPDGTRVAVRILGDQPAVWIYDLVRDTSTRLTFESDEVGAFFPTWTPDGTRVAFGPPLSWKRADGIGAVEGLDDAGGRFPQAFSPDGTTLVFEDRAAADGGAGLGVLTLEGDRTATFVIDGEFTERNAALSPDGRWLAYSSDETGQRQVYVQPFPDVDGGRWQISTDGGDWPVWNPAGGELFYRAVTGVMALAFETEPTFTPGALTQLFEQIIIIGGNNRRMALSPDGQRFLLFANATENADSEAAPSQLIVVQNWFEELRRLVPVN